MTGRQAGTWTFLFTDIEASTRRWQADRVAMAAALEVHDATLARVIDGSGGRVFKHTGDGVCAVFGSVGDAVAAASAAQDALELPVRMGVHTGDAEEHNDDFDGMTLNRCARIMDAGHGGQVLLSSIAAALHGGEVMDLGEHLLKGVMEPERIWQLERRSFRRCASPHGSRRCRRRSLRSSVVTHLSSTWSTGWQCRSNPAAA